MGVDSCRLKNFVALQIDRKLQLAHCMDRVAVFNTRRDIAANAIHICALQSHYLRYHPETGDPQVEFQAYRRQDHILAARALPIFQIRKLSQHQSKCDIHYIY